MRGRLIQRFLVDIDRLDEATTEAVAGAGFDPDFGEPLPVQDGTQLGQDSRQYHATETLKCQLDRDDEWGKRMTTRTGQEIVADIVIALHAPELQKKGLILANGEPIYQAGDKILRIKTLKGNLEQEFRDPPGMFIEGVERAGYGLNAFGTPKTNLFYLYCSYKKEGTQV